MAYVPPHRRKKASPATPDLLGTASSASTVRTTTTRQKTPHDEKMSTTAVYPLHRKTHYQYRWQAAERDSIQKDDDLHHDDIDLVCTVLTRVCCINLQQRPDKWQRILQQANHVHERFTNKLERFEAIQWRGDNDRGEDVIMDSSSEENNQKILVKRKWNATKNAQYCSRVKINTGTDDDCIKVMTAGEVGCALSHIKLWQQLCLLGGLENATSNSSSSGGGGGDTELNDTTTPTNKSTVCMLILEDDVVFTCCKRGTSRFARAFAKVWKMLPSDWSILYLGFSSRGERLYINENIIDGVAGTQEQQLQSHGQHAKSSNSSSSSTSSSTRRLNNNPLDPEIRLYRPTYGFHTHAYVINKTGATKLLENLPVVGPIDVWLADNAWFGLRVYCAVIAHEGWRRDDGTFEGANLINQDRKYHQSDIQQSAHAAS